MLLLIAQLSTVIDSDAAKLAFGAGVIGAIAYGLSLLRGLRKDITSEVRMQLRDDEYESEAGKFPQPLSIKAHIDFTPYNEHKELKSEFEKLRDQRRDDMDGLHQKIEDGLKKTSEDLAKTNVEIGKMQVTQQAQNLDLHAIRKEQSKVSERIDSMPGRIVQNLRDTKGLL